MTEDSVIREIPFLKICNPFIIGNMVAEPEFDIFNSIIDLIYVFG